MISFAVTRIVDQTRRVEEAADRAARRAYAKAAYRIFRDAQQSITRSKKPSTPGNPPHTRRGKLKRAIRYDANATGAVIGPVRSMVGEAGMAHEFGGTYKDAQYDERAFMGPALDRELDKFAGEFAGSIGE